MNFHTENNRQVSPKHSLIKKQELSAERETEATIFTLLKGEIDFHNFHFLTVSKQINSNFDFKSI